MKASSISSADLDAIREDLLQTVWSATLPFQQELLSCGGVTFRGLRNAVTDAICAGPIASEIARLTGERDAAVKSLNACIADMERGGTCKRVYSDAALGRELEAAEAETARLRAENQDLMKSLARAVCEIASLTLALGRDADLSSQEQADV